MPRKSLESAADLIFGSHAQAEVIYFLLASEGRTNAYRISSFTGIDHKTTSMMLKRLHKLEGIENSDNKTPIGISLKSELLQVLESLFIILDRKRIIKYNGKTYWLLNTEHDLDDIRKFRYDVAIGFYYDILLAKFDDTYYAYVHSNDKRDHIENESLFIRSFLFHQRDLVEGVEYGGIFNGEAPVSLLYDVSKAKRLEYFAWLKAQRKIFGTDQNLLFQIIKKHSEIIKTLMNPHQKNV